MLSKELSLKSLMCAVNAPSKSVQICAKTVMSLFLPIMDDADKACLQLTTDEISHLMKLLCVATRDGEAEEGLLTYTLAELLTSLTCLFSLPLHGNVVSTTVDEILEPLKLLIVSDKDYMLQKMSLRLLWNLLSYCNLSTCLFTDHQDLCLMLKFIGDSPSIDLSLIAQSTLKTIFWNSSEGESLCAMCEDILAIIYFFCIKFLCLFLPDIHLKFLYAYASMLCDHLDESISMCQHILKHLQNSHHSLADDCKLVLGKCLARKYSQEQRLLELKMDYFSAAEFGKNKMIQSCYSKTKDAIILLGCALDKGLLDHESSMLLDFAMIDCSRELNALHECSRCFLCRKQKKLCRSHICPEFIYREISKETYKPDPTKATLTTMTGRHEVKTPKSDTKWLLCGSCEGLLSHHGESQFLKFFRFIYPKILRTCIKYGKEVYNFCIGMALRSLCITNFSCLSNKSEIYEFLVACRNYLLSLTEDSCKLPLDLKKPKFFIYRNPIKLYSTKEVREDILSGILDSSFVVQISTYHLDGAKSHISEGCFFIIIMGGIMILTRFSADESFAMPESFVPISPDGGEYFVLDEARRWKDIPPGVFEILKENVLQIQSRVAEVFWGKVPLPGRHKSTQLPRSWDTEIATRPVSPISAELSDLQQKLLSGILQEGITKLNLLPEGIVVSKNPPISKVLLPSGHKIVKHSHSRAKRVTILLSTDGESYYAIVVQRKGMRELTYGFRLEENKDSYVISDLLVSSSVEGAKSAFLDGIVPTVTDVLESLWSDFGSFQGFLHHAEIER